VFIVSVHYDVQVLSATIQLELCDHAGQQRFNVLFGFGTRLYVEVHDLDFSKDPNLNGKDDCYHCHCEDNLCICHCVSFVAMCLLYCVLADVSTKNYSAHTCGPKEQSLGNAKVEQEPCYSDPTNQFNHCRSFVAMCLV
jgi:hypothetical protein